MEAIITALLVCTCNLILWKEKSKEKSELRWTKRKKGDGRNRELRYGRGGMITGRRRGKFVAITDLDGLSWFISDAVELPLEAVCMCRVGGAGGGA